MSHTPNYMDKANEKGSGDIQQKRDSLLAGNSHEDDNMDRLQAAAECLLYMQNDNDTEQRPGIDVFGSRPPHPDRRQDRDNWNAGLQPGNNKRPRVMPDQFNGNGSWPEFISHFEICADLNEWSNRQKAQYLSVSLRGAACQLLRTLTPAKRLNYHELVTALGRRFNPENQTELFRAELRNCQRLASQSLPELAQEVRRLVHLAYPTASQDVMDVLGRDYFIDALDDSDLRWRVYQVKAKSLDDAVCAAVEMEAYKKAERQRIQPRKSVRQVDLYKYENSLSPAANDMSLEKIQQQMEQLKEMMEKLKQKPNFSQQGSGKKERKDIECWNCGIKGHYRSECRKPRQFQKPQNLSN